MTAQRYGGTDEAPIVAGFDLGGSHSVCLVATAGGHIIGRGAGGAASIVTEGRAAVLDSVRRSLTEAAAELTAGPAGIARCYLGAAGAGLDVQASELTGVLREAGLRCPLTVAHDAAIALAGATLLNPGIIIMAGTGSVAYGFDRSGREGRAGGWGPLLGDEGSGFDIGRHALQAVLRSLDARDPPTVLTGVVSEAFGLGTLEDYRRFARQPNLDRTAVAGLARAVADQARNGEPAAHRIISDAAAELALTVIAVAKQLKAGKELPVTYGGGLFEAGEPLLTPFLASLRRWNPEACLTPPAAPPVVGAVLKALAEEGLACGETIGTLLAEWRANGGDR